MTVRASPLDRRHATPGFTLLEVMIALALLGLGMVVLIKSAAGNIFSTEDARMMGIATDLARGKMYDIEEILLKDGFTDTSQSDESEKCFEDEGWPNICFSYKVEEPTLPSMDQIQAAALRQAEKAAKETGVAAGSDAAAAFESTALGGMLSMMGSFGGGKMDITAAQGADLLQGQWSTFQEILKVSIRKVSLTVKWKVLGRDRDMKVVAFFTDAAAMDKVLSGLGSEEYDPNQPNPSNPSNPSNPRNPRSPGSAQEPRPRGGG